jgi:glycerate kinase
MKVIIAIDSFKGCISSKEANQAAAEGIKNIMPEADIHQVTVSDGGEGFMEAFHAAIGGNWNYIKACDPLMRPITAKYLQKDKLAVIEMAAASGLTLLKEEERNPMHTTTYGTGQLIANAIKHGVNKIIVGLGGSATSDAGTGMLKALIDNFTHNGIWDDINILKDVHFTIASDVKNPLYGPNGAAHVFGAQKGATPKMIEQLDSRAKVFAQKSAKHFGYDYSTNEGAGAAGGLGYALMQYLNADCRPGTELLLDTIHFDYLTKEADYVITGEGSADKQTLMGKLPIGILQHSGKSKCCLIAGRINDKQQLLQAGFHNVTCINPPGISIEEAMRKDVALRNIQDTVKSIIE